MARGDWRVWLRIGALGFGGPAGQIAVLQRELVDQRHWVTHDELTRAIALTSMLPGPEAHQTATYIGLKRGGLRGALSAAVLFIAPGALITALLAALYLSLGELSVVAGGLKGLQASVVVIIVAALISIGRRSLLSAWLWLVSAVSFVASFFVGVPFILVAAIVATAGYIASRWTRVPAKGAALAGLDDSRNADAGDAGASDAAASASDDPSDATASPGEETQASGATTTLALGLALISSAVMLVLVLNLTTESTTRWGQLAWVLLVSAFTLGGAYAIVDYATQALVIDYAWLSTADMSVGLGLGESTPGPLVLVIEFASFLAMAGQGPWQGVAGALLAVFVIFSISTGLLLTVARFADQIMGAPRLRFATQAVSAAVVGVILSLGLAFALTTFFATVDLARPLPWLQVPLPDLASFAWGPTLIAAIAAVLLFRLRLQIWQVVLVCAGLGAILSAVPIAA